MAVSENKVYVAVGKQTVAGTAVAPTTYLRWNDSTSFDPDMKTEEIREGDGSPSVARTLKNLQFWKGKIGHGHPRSIDFGVMLNAVMGIASDTVTGGADPYTHTFTPQGERALHTLYMRYKELNEGVMFTDVKFHSMIITGQSGKRVVAEYDWVGLKASDDTSALTPVFDADSDMFFYVGGTFTVDGSTVGSVAPFIADFKIEYLYPLDESIQTESINLDETISTLRTVKCEFKVLFKDMTMFKKVYFNAGSTDSGTTGTGSLKLKFLAGGSNANRSIELQLNNIDYTAAKMPSPKLSGKAMWQTITATASGSSELIAILKNSQATSFSA